MYTTIAVILWSGELGLGHYTTIAKIGDDAYFVYAMKNNIYGIPYAVIAER